MVSLRKGIYNSEFVYKEENGVVEHTLILKPLKGKFLPSLLAVASRFSGLTEKSSAEEVLAKLDEPTTEKLVNICFSAVKN
ncbi:hypothetical protein DRN98_04000, partial [Methanosarcinales archaeon]